MRESRTLREYERVAYQDHVCGICQRQINPGDFYRGSVSRTRYDRISTFKEHIEPPCPEEFFEEMEEEIDKAIARDEKKEKREPSPMRRAA